jgi:hypothetical protein
MAPFDFQDSHRAHQFEAKVGREGRAALTAARGSRIASRAGDTGAGGTGAALCNTRPAAQGCRRCLKPSSPCPGCASTVARSPAVHAAAAHPRSRQVHLHTPRPATTVARSRAAHATAGTTVAPRPAAHAPAAHAPSHRAQQPMPRPSTTVARSLAAYVAAGYHRGTKPSSPCLGCASTVGPSPAARATGPHPPSHQGGVRSVPVQMLTTAVAASREARSLRPARIRNPDVDPGVTYATRRRVDK